MSCKVRTWQQAGRRGAGVVTESFRAERTAARQRETGGDIQHTVYSLGMAWTFEAFKRTASVYFLQ